MRAAPEVLFVDPTTIACESAMASFVDGAASVVLAADEADLVPEALAAAAFGFAVVSTRVIDGARGLPALSLRDRTLLTLVASGASNAEVAQRLRRSTATVKRELRRLADQLDVDGRPGLIAAARDMGLS